MVLGCERSVASHFLARRFRPIVGLHVFTLCAILFLGCGSPHVPTSDSAHLGSFVEKRITLEEARHLLLNDLERALSKAQVSSAFKNGNPAEVGILLKERARLSSHLESFLAHSRKGDQLWTYRT